MILKLIFVRYLHKKRQEAVISLSPYQLANVFISQLNVSVRLSLLSSE